MNTSFNVFALSRRGNGLARLGWQANSLLVTATLILSAFPAGFAFAATTGELPPSSVGTYSTWDTGDDSDIDEDVDTASCSSGDSLIDNDNNGRSSFTVSLSSIPNGATITSVQVRAADRGDSASGGQYATFVRFNGADSANSSTHTVSGTSGGCSGLRTDIFDVVDTVKSGATTLEIGVIKIGTTGVRVGAVDAVVTFDMDGLGEMDVTPTTVAANSTGNSFTFTFNNDTGADFSASSMIRLTIPAGWTDPTGNLTVTDVGGSGCNPDTTPAISGTGPWTVDITHDCDDNNSFTVDYDNVTAPATLGAHEFTTLSQDGVSTLTAITVQPTVTVEASHQITVTNGGNGTVTPGTTAVIDGEDQTFDIDPDTGYIVADVLVDTVSQGRVNSYEFTNVTTVHTLDVTFENGWTQPTDSENNDGVTSPDNAFSSDNADAVFDSDGEDVEYDEFGTLVPSGALIEGIEVALEGARSSTRTLLITLSWDNGSNWTSSQTVAFPSSTDSTVVVGGPTDLWGHAWTESELSNANFEVRVDEGGESGSINLDQIQVKVYYDIDTTAPTGGSITYTDGYNTTGSVDITYATGDDEIGGSGLDTASGKIQRAGASLGLGGVCGAFGSFADLVTESDGMYTDASVASGNCYMYQYVIEDNLNNVATYTSTNVVKVDTVAPTVVIDTQVLVASPTNINPIPMVVTFSEEVTGFDDTDLAIVGGTASNFAVVDATEYTFDLVPNSDPITMTVNIGAGAATDLTLVNQNTAATQFARTYNSTALSVTITSGPADGDVITVNNTAFSFTTDGDDASCALDSVPGIPPADPCTSFVAPTGSHTLAGPLAEGPHTFQVRVVKAGFDDVILETDFTVDTTQPTVTLSSLGVIGGFASTSPLTIDVLFSDAVMDFLDGDVTAVGGTLGSLSGSGASYAADLTIGADGPVTVDLAAGVATEDNGSGWTNLAASQLAFIFDSTAPVIDITAGPADGSATTTTSGMFEFNVTDANSVDVTCSFDAGATTTPCTSPQAWGPVADGVHAFLIHTIDAAGNFAEELVSFTVDTVAPVLTEVTAIGTTQDTTPDYTFNSTEDGTFALGGSCSVGSTSATSGDNTITLNALSVGTYTDCTVTLTDEAGNVSNILDISDFTIEAPPSSGGGGGGGGGSSSNFPQAQSTPIPGFTGPTTGGGQVLGASTEFTGDTGGTGSDGTGGVGGTGSGGQVLGASTSTGSGGTGSGAQSEPTDTETATTTGESQANDSQAAAAGFSMDGIPAWLIAILVILIALGLWFGWQWYYGN